MALTGAARRQRRLPAPFARPLRVLSATETATDTAMETAVVMPTPGAAAPLPAPLPVPVTVVDVPGAATSASGAATPVAAQTEATRRLLAVWLAHPQPVVLGSRRAGGGLAVPAAEAATVIEAARELARDALPEPTRVAVPAGDASPFGERPAPPAGLLRLAETMVVAEHPSASQWTAAERRLAASWIAVLLDRQGEDGVQRLVRTLCAAPVPTRPTRPSNPVRLSCVDPESGPARS